MGGVVRVFENGKGIKVVKVFRVFNVFNVVLGGFEGIFIVIEVQK